MNVVDAVPGVEFREASACSLDREELSAQRVADAAEEEKD